VIDPSPTDVAATGAALVAGAGERSAPAERRDEIRRRVVEEGYARIDDLSRAFGVSVMTVHRDLDVLAQEGWLTKIRGGATANPSVLVEAGVRKRTAVLQAEKAAIGAQAARLLRAGQTIFVDDSTTALGLLPYLETVGPITVATNFMPVANALSAAPKVEVVILGGRYYPLQEACFGLQTCEAIHQLHADLLFMSTTAVHSGSCYHRSEMTVMVKRAFMQCAARTVLLVDHAKFGRPAPHLLCPVSAFDLVITDTGIHEDDLAELREVHAVVEVASP
jgi:DeoR/GlpR family transcriptional regulator of sugar metabolism